MFAFVKARWKAAVPPGRLRGERSRQTRPGCQDPVRVEGVRHVRRRRHHRSPGPEHAGETVKHFARLAAVVLLTFAGTAVEAAPASAAIGKLTSCSEVINPNAYSTRCTNHNLDPLYAGLQRSTAGCYNGQTMVRVYGNWVGINQWSIAWCPTGYLFNWGMTFGILYL